MVHQVDTGNHDHFVPLELSSIDPAMDNPNSKSPHLRDSDSVAASTAQGKTSYDLAHDVAFHNSRFQRSSLEFVGGSAKVESCGELVKRARLQHFIAPLSP